VEERVPQAGAGQNGEARDFAAAKNLRLGGGDWEMGIVLVGGRRELSTDTDKERDERYSSKEKEMRGNRVVRTEIKDT
jgi:hypothetical protein